MIASLSQIMIVSSSQIMILGAKASNFPVEYHALFEANTTMPVKGQKNSHNKENMGSFIVILRYFDVARETLALSNFCLD